MLRKLRNSPLMGVIALVFLLPASDAATSYMLISSSHPRDEKLTIPDPIRIGCKHMALFLGNGLLMCISWIRYDRRWTVIYLLIILWLGYQACGAFFHYWPIQNITTPSLNNPPYFYVISKQVRIYTIFLNFCVVYSISSHVQRLEDKLNESTNKLFVSIHIICGGIVAYMFMTAISVIVYGFSPIPAGTFTAAEILRPTINFPITGITLNYILMRVARECAKSKNYPLEEEALEDEATLPTVAPEPIATPTLEHESEKLESSGIERVTQ